MWASVTAPMGSGTHLGRNSANCLCKAHYHFQQSFFSLFISAADTGTLILIQHSPEKHEQTTPTKLTATSTPLISNRWISFDTTQCLGFRAQGSLVLVSGIACTRSVLPLAATFTFWAYHLLSEADSETHGAASWQFCTGQINGVLFRVLKACLVQQLKEIKLKTWNYEFCLKHPGGFQVLKACLVQQLKEIKLKTSNYEFCLKHPGGFQYSSLKKSN